MSNVKIIVIGTSEVHTAVDTSGCMCVLLMHVVEAGKSVTTNVLADTITDPPKTPFRLTQGVRFVDIIATVSLDCAANTITLEPSTESRNLM